MRLASIVIAVLVFCAISAIASDRQKVSGVVTDPTGAVIAGAEVQLVGEHYESRIKTSPQGRFGFDDLPIDRGTLQVSAAGFALSNQMWTAPSPALTIELKPALKLDQVTVSGTRVAGRLADSASSVAILSRTDLMSAGAVTLDDALRQIPGFTLFRRSGSLAANPTTQGMSLRGVGASGASRAAVLYDGVPLNDPFGGWVYWDRVPLAAIQDAEVLRGGASDLYGAAAMSGVVNIVPRQPPASVLSVETYLGNSRTPEGSFFWNGRREATQVTASGEAFATGGYYLVREQDRGTVDTRAGQQHRTGSLAVERDLSSGSRVFLRGSLFREQRDNGTVLQNNNTRIEQIVTGVDYSSARAGAFNLRVDGEREHYFQTFSAVSIDRNSESLSRTQVVPAQRLGLSIAWTRAVSRHTLVLGIDSQDVRGHSNELVFAGGRPAADQDSGGRQRFAAIFGEDILQLGPNWVVTAAVRFDRWRNFSAFSRTAPLGAGASSFIGLPSRSDATPSPRLSVLRHISHNWSATASAYGSFRAPTLNELYRPFRVGNTLTVANPELRAEQLRGAEAGVLGRINGKVSLRGTFFWALVSDPIANVTLSSTANLITQKRENLGRARSRGVEFEADAQLSPRLTLTGGYQFTDATVIRSTLNLAGNWIPQVPHQQFSLQGRYATIGGFALALQGRYVGVQFEDDRNALPLDPFFTLDASVSHHLRRYLDVFVAAENLLDRQYVVGRTPTVTVGPPLLARVGLHFDFPVR